MTGQRITASAVAARAVEVEQAEADERGRRMRARVSRGPVPHRPAVPADVADVELAEDDGDDEDGPDSDPALMGDDWQSRSLRARVPDKPLALRPGELACCACGQPVPAPPPDRRGELVYARRMGAATTTMPAYTAERVPLTRCPGCAGLRELAHRIVAGRPSLQSRLGGVAVDRIEAALSCLAACQVAPPAVNASAAVIGALVRLSQPGVGVRWQEQEFTKIKDRCAPRPWACVPISAREEASKAAAGFLAACVQTTAPDQMVACPPAPALPGNVGVGSGCLLCGAPSIRASADQIANAEQSGVSLWTEHRSISAPLLGAHTPGTMRVSGHLCPTCETVYQQEMCWGPTIREAACAVYQKSIGRDDRAALLRLQEVTPIAWAGRVADAAHRKLPEPVPGKPWAWVVWPVEERASKVSEALNVLEESGMQPSLLDWEPSR